MTDTNSATDESGQVDPAVWGMTDDASSFGFLQLAKAEPRARPRPRRPELPNFNEPGLLERAPAVDDAASRLRLDSAVRPASNEMWSEWEPPQWPSLRLFARMCQTAIRPSAPTKKRRVALRWCFDNTLSDGAMRVTFARVCHVLEARTHVMQSAVQHYLFRRAIVIDEPLGDNPCLPKEHADEAVRRDNRSGLAVATDVWRHPSRPITQVIAGLAASGVDDADEVIAVLVDAGMLGLASGRVWFAARSTDFTSSRRTSFARSFVYDDDGFSRFDGGPDVLTPFEREVLFGMGGDSP